MADEPARDPTMGRLTGGWFPCRPTAYEKSVVLGGARVLYPIENPEKIAGVLNEHIHEVASRAFRAGMAHAKAEIRKVLW